MALPRRRAAEQRGSGLRPGIVFSALLHLGLAALVVAASLQREKPPEPLPPPSYAVEFEGGAPERPAEPETNPAQSEAGSEPEQESSPPPVTDAEPPPTTELALAPPAEPAPPPPLPQPEEPRPAEAEQPQPDDLPTPPPPAPPQPQRQAALTAPPRPARPPGPEPLPGLYMPDLRNLQPAPGAPSGPRRGLDLSLGQVPQSGRDTPEPQASVRGAQVGPDWRNAFRRWLEENKRYPENARVVGEQGTNRIELIVDPDGRVRSARLLRRSGSVWLDAGTVSLFRNAVLPPFPPGADPGGVTVDLTINYILIR